VKAKRFLLFIIGMLLLIVSVVLALVALVALIKGLAENNGVFVASLIISVLSFSLNLLCVRARRRLLNQCLAEQYADINRVVIAHTEAEFDAYSVPFESIDEVRGKLKNTLNVVIHFNDGSVRLRRIKPKSLEYRFLAPFIQ
jgi:Na+/melibiose symporter-like transporter